MFHAILISLLLICNLVPISPEDIVDQIIEIAQKETLTQEDCKKVIKLANSNTVELDKFLVENEFIYDFKMELLDAIYTDAYNLFGDIVYLAEKEKICKWAQHTYPEESKEHKVADSRLVEIYALWGKFSMAIKQLDKNLSSCNYPSLDYATCIYSKAWMQMQMGMQKSAKETMNLALQEYQTLVRLGEDTIKSKSISSSQLEYIKAGINEAQRGIHDATVFLQGLDK